MRSTEEYMQSIEQSGFQFHGKRPFIGDFGNNRELSEKLLQLVRSGNKTATSCLKAAWLAEEERLPEPGDWEIVLDWDGNPTMVYEYTEVQIYPFNKVPDKVAIDEGEGDQTVSYWKEVHWEFFSGESKRLGLVPTEEMEVITFWFKILHQIK